MRLILLATLVAVASAGSGMKCTFPSRGDSSDPSCVWDDYDTAWYPASRDFRCCLNDASDNINCGTDHISTVQCAEINATNSACSNETLNDYYAVGFTSTNWDCDDYAPDCLETLACDTENGYTGTPWIMCNEDGGVFEMFGCVRGAADPVGAREVYLPYKYMNVDLTSSNRKYSLDSASQSCADTDCAAFIASNGACNQLGDCSTMGEYKVFQDAEYTDLFPDVSMDTYVNPFRWIGPPQDPQVPVTTDQDDPDGIRIADLDFYTPMFDCYSYTRGFFKYRLLTINEIDQEMSATGLVNENFGFTQTVYDYIVNDLGVNEDLLTSGAGGQKTTPDGTDDPFGAHEYFGKIEDGAISAIAPELAGKFVGGPLICNIDNGQGCTIDGCAWMCQVTEQCDAFAIIDFCNTDDGDSPLRPTCDTVDRLLDESGRIGSFDRSKRAVCAFHYFDIPDKIFKVKPDATKGRSGVLVERSTSMDTQCTEYSDARCSECTKCENTDGDDKWLNQGECQGGGTACDNNKMVRDISEEWAYVANDDTLTCDLCPTHCTDCTIAGVCSECDSLSGLFEVNDDADGCTELGCTVDISDFPANSAPDGSGSSGVACLDGENVEPYAYCDIKCNTSFYQSAGSSLVAQCNGTDLLMDYPAITCTACSDANCLTCPSDSCTVCAEGYEVNAGSCDLVTCPLADEAGPDCTVCSADTYGTISWDSATESWDTSGCRTCSNILSNCLNCNGTSSGDAVCIECQSGYALDGSDDCIEMQYCPDGTEGVSFYDIGDAAFNFSGCVANDECPKTSETKPDCWDCPTGYAGSVEWIMTNTTHGYWSTSQCELVECPTAGETSPACTACPWGYTGTAYWDDETETWAGCVSNEFGIRRVAASAVRASARSTTPVLSSRNVVASFSADGAVVEEVETAPYKLNRQSSAYFFKNNGAYSTAEHIWNCPPGFGGADCSLRMCPHSATSFGSDDGMAIASSEGLFWTTDIGQKSSANFHGRHMYRECAGRGVCDYSTGECDCFPGFTGRGCRRRECPNSCSGHGVCLDDDRKLFHNVHASSSVTVLPSDLYSDSVATSDPNFWSTASTQSCVCDGGWTGHDCSLRLCPVGDDPETDCNDELGYDVQRISCTGMDKDVDHYFSLAFTTALGIRYNTPPIIISAFDEEGNVTATANSLQTALESLPNFAIPSVEVTVEHPDVVGADFGTNMTITFVDPATTGEQHLLEVTESLRCEGGSSSYFFNTDMAFECTVERVSQSTQLREQAECSNRGTCNTRTGECQCFDGYEGVSCQTIAATI